MRGCGGCAWLGVCAWLQGACVGYDEIRSIEIAGVTHPTGMHSRLHRVSIIDLEWRIYVAKFLTRALTGSNFLHFHAVVSLTK